MDKISAFTIAYNERNRIMPCICSLIGQVDQVVIVDDGSDDTSMVALYSIIEGILKGHGIEFTLIGKEHLGSHALHLETALAACRHEWVFQLDADEVLCGNIGALRKAISDSHGAVSCSRDTYVQDRTSYKLELSEPKINLFNRFLGYYPKEHGVAWVSDVDSIAGDFHINHCRTEEEKHVDSLRYFSRYLKEYSNTDEGVRKQYYSDKFNRICEYYHFPFKSINEVLERGEEACLEIIR